MGDGCAADHPVHTVSWFDVVKWCNAKSEKEGLTPAYTVGGATYKAGETNPDWNTAANGYRLPREAEWEFAARGGNQTNGFIYNGSNDLNAVGWHMGNSDGAACDLYDGRGTWPAGKKAANELGLHDMSGNVWEWCWDGRPQSPRPGHRGNPSTSLRPSAWVPTTQPHRKMLLAGILPWPRSISRRNSLVFTRRPIGVRMPYGRKVLATATKHLQHQADRFILLTMEYQGRISIDPAKRSGKPCIRNLRITVADILSYLASGMTHEEVLADFPELEPEDIRAVLAFAAERENRLMSA